MRIPSLPKLGSLTAARVWRKPGGAARLEVWLPRGWPREGAEFRWRRIAPGERTREGHGSEGLIPAQEVVVWTPAAETLLLRAQLPTRSAAKIAQALPYAIEEQLIDSPEQLHFAFVHEADGALAVAVTHREKMDRWLAALTSAGLQPSRMAPVTLSLPFAGSAWTLAFGEEELVLRTGLHSGLGGPSEASPPAWLRAALAEARSENRAPERILFVDPPAGADLAAWSNALGLPVETVRVESAPPVPAASLNLLQQRYAPRARMAGLWRAYMPAAALLAAWLAGTFVFDAIEWIRVSRSARAGDEEMRALLLKSFPDTRAVLDPAEQMRRGLEALVASTGAAGPDDMLALLERTLPVIERESRVRLQAVEYTEHTLSLRLAAAEPEADALARTLRAQQLEVDVQRSGGEAQLRVRAAGVKGPQ